MSTHSEQVPSLDASNEVLQNAHSSDEDFSTENPSPGAYERLYGNLDGKSGKNSNRPAKRNADGIHTTLEYNEDGQLQIISPDYHDNLVKDKRSLATWRHRTIAERNLIANLDQARSSNLTVHLYNTSKLKQRAKSQTSDCNGVVETKKVPKPWVAWPLPPDIVPRDHEQTISEDENWRTGPYIRKERRPGDELRELLTARAIKTGKEKFTARSSESSLEESEDDEYERPVVLTDDEFAERMLQPSIQNLLGNLDRVLTSLHHARSSYMVPMNSVRKRAIRNVKFSADKQVRKAAYLGARGTDNDENPSESSGSEVEIGEPNEHINQRTKRCQALDVPTEVDAGFVQRKARVVGLRDWTDVLGAASITGLDSNVISRTVSRCADLFSADQNHRVVEGGLTDEKATFYLPYNDSSNGADNLKVQDFCNEKTRDGIHVDGYLHKIEGKVAKKRTRCENDDQ